MFVITVGTITVVGTLSWNTFANPQKNYPDQCALVLANDTVVRTEVKIAVDGLAYPRITTDLIVQIPIATPDSERLLFHEDDSLKQSALGCVLHAVKEPNEVRANSPRVARVGDVFELTDHVHVDVLRPGTFWSGTTEVKVSAEGPWTLTVHPPPGLSSARWNVAVSAPDGWLSSPVPWRSADVGLTQVRWAAHVSTPEGERVSAKLEPDSRTEIMLRTQAPVWKTWVSGIAAGSSLCFAVLAFLVLGVRRHQFEPVARRTARRAVWPLLLISLVVGILTVSSAILEYKVIEWWLVDWYINIGFAVLLSLLAFAWWLPRSLVFLSGAAMLMTLSMMPLGDGIEALAASGSGIVNILDVVLAFLMTMTLVMAVGKAVHVLLGNGEPHTAPRWLWITGSSVAVVLVMERYAIAVLNSARQEWLGFRSSVDLTNVYRIYPWELFNELGWLLLALSAVALWHFVKVCWFEPVESRSLLVGVVFFTLGPMRWDIGVMGWTVPAWLIMLLVLAGLVLFYGKVRPSVLRRSGTGADLVLAKIRAKARRWYRNPTRSSTPSPVDVLLAVGPVGAPLENLKTAVRLGVVPALVAGVGLVVMDWTVYPLVTISQEYSVLLGLVADIVWEAEKWLLAMAALGLAWQHLPGRRGVTKFVPVVIVYGLIPIANFLIDYASGGIRDWPILVEVATFFLVGMYVSLRMDKTTLDAVQSSDLAGNRIQRMLNAYGLENFSARVTALLAPVIAALAIWSAVQGGDVTYPTVDPTQAPRGGQVAIVNGR